MKEDILQAEVKNFDSPEDVRTFPNGRVEIINVGGKMIGRATLEPGWKWSTCVKPIVNTASCQAAHFQYHVSGMLEVWMDNGTHLVCKPGDISHLAPGHDAWVVGNEPVVVIDFQGMVDYAKP